ncbi:cytochrome c-type biogenesis protein CcmH [Candidatus Pelagibacter sp.]|nr:cytochrome c-type biogenesis protein CcmH [Candidatus Pelagibacter sp.]
MRFFKTFLLIFLFANVTSANVEVKNNDIKSKILKNIRCLVCQGQSVYDSESEFSDSIKLLVKKKIIEGKSEEQIYEFLRDKYGDWIIYDPKLNKNTYILWLLPLLLFLLGGAIMIKKLNFKK